MIDKDQLQKFFVNRALVLAIFTILAFFAYLGYVIYGPDTSPTTTQETEVVVPETKIQINVPLVGALDRITKKPFGVYVTPANSLVQPERFTGFHTGTDFETTSAEANTTVPTASVCPGTVRSMGVVDGYGGLIILDCTIDSQPVTVLYGHIDLASSTLAVGDTVADGQYIANLAPAYSAGSGGERKHLHLGIHIGSTIEYRGYVQNESELSGWLDFQKIRH